MLDVYYQCYCAGCGQRICRARDATHLGIRVARVCTFVGTLGYVWKHRVDAVQQMLGTHVPVDQQILMYEGRRLEPQQLLSAYGLPATGLPATVRVELSCAAVGDAQMNTHTSPWTRRHPLMLCFSTVAHTCAPEVHSPPLKPWHPWTYKVGGVVLVCPSPRPPSCPLHPPYVHPLHSAGCSLHTLRPPPLRTRPQPPVPCVGGL